LTAYTVLAGDANPANDTVRATTSISTVSNWIQCADLPTAEECQGMGYDPVNDKVYSFGGYHGDNTCQNYTYQYDPVTNTWATMAPMPFALDWLDASCVNGKFYIMGGFDAATPHNYCLIYDIAGNSWSQGATMPQARIAGGQMIYNDSLIYMCGGYNGSAPTTNVQIYNTYTNAWTVGTALPAADMMCGVAMTGDTLWLVGGYSGACYTNLYYGVINPTTNETITWSTGSALAVPNFNNGATMMTRNGNWYLYVVGGFENASTITSAAWEYNVGADAWNALPAYPFTVTRNDILVAREGHNEIYVAGGDNSGGWTENSQCWKLQWMLPGVEEKPGTTPKVAFGFAPSMNPVKNRVSLSYAIPQTGNVSLKVYDGMGRLVKVLAQGVQPAGTKTVTWNLKDDAGRSLMSGVYFVRLESNGQTMSQKLVLVK
jgi:N-acetylneuraminic acid mutarotase